MTRSSTLSLAALLCLMLCPGLAAQATFTDQTVAAGLVATHAPDTLCFQSQAWQTGGMAVGDFNNDGWQDLFWLGGGGTPDKLFINDGDGTFSDEAAAWGVAATHAGCGASTGDYDNDGFLDIYVTSFGANADCEEVTFPFELTNVCQHKLYHNNGNGTFSDVAVAAGVNCSAAEIATGYGSAFGDYDMDGDLDLAVAGWWANQFTASDGNRLFRNEGDGTFTDVTASALPASIHTAWGFQPAFVDMDGDLWPELLLAADFQTSRYYVNNGDGTFTDQTVASGTGLDDEGMGQTVADFNADGRFDWYVTSVHLNVPPPGHNNGNMLYRSTGDHQFAEISNDVGVNDGGWGWGTIATDVDLDGSVDLVEVNGRQADEHCDEPTKLFHNQGDGTFSEIAAAAGLNSAEQGRALVAFDADNDGDQDLAIANNGLISKLCADVGALQFFRNDHAPATWVRIALDTSTNPRLAPNGSGARVEVTTTSQTHIRFMHASPSYLATSEWAVHFGLGSATIIDEIRVIWPRGYVTVLHDQPINQHMTIAAPEVADLNGDGVVNAADLAQVLGHWGVTDPSSMVMDFNDDGVVNAADLALLLGAWS